MALRHTFEVAGKSIVFGESINIDNGNVTTRTNPLYIKVASINATKEKGRCRVVFYDGDEVVSMKSYEFIPSMDGANFIKQAYEHLKTLPEFAGVADV